MSLFRFTSRPAQLHKNIQVASRSCANTRRKSVQQHSTENHRERLAVRGFGDTPKDGSVVGQELAYLENVFFTSLSAAGTCRDCRESQPQPFYLRELPRSSLRSSRHARSPKRWYTTSREGELAKVDDHDDGNTINAEHRSVFSKKDYLSLLNTYGRSLGLIDEDKTRNVAFSRRSTTAVDHSPLASRLIYTPEQEQRLKKRKKLPPEDEAHAAALLEFRRSTEQKLGYASLEKLWNQYLALRQPRVRYISPFRLRRFFRHLYWVERKDGVASERYLTLFRECLDEQVEILEHEWNTAISFAGKWTRVTSTAEVKSAVEMWMLMEQHGMQASAVTFTILFDIAVKARRFGLADTIYKELEARGLKPTRPLRTAVISYAGLRREGEAVRQAFRDLVNAGEIIDTAIMNTVLVSLLRAGEPAAAENVFLRMKRLQATKFTTKPPHDWRRRRRLGVELARKGEALRREQASLSTTFFGSPLSTDEQREAVQEQTPIGPDAWTYGILIKWYCYAGCDLKRCRELLAEMRKEHLVITNSIYIALFQGFANHGGHAYTEWNRRSLEALWTEFISLAIPSQGLRALPASTHDGQTTALTPDEAADSSEDNRTQRINATSQQQHGIAGNTTLSRRSEAERSVTIETPSSTSDDIPITSILKKQIEPDYDSKSEEVTTMELKPLHFSRQVVGSILNAFWTCAGAPRTLEVWATAQQHWSDLSAEDRAVLQMSVDRYVRRNNMFR